MPLDHYVTLGRSGLRVSPLCLGAMTFGEDLGWGSSVEDSETDPRPLRRPGRQLHRHRQLLHQGPLREDHRRPHRPPPARRDRLVIATKFSGNLYPGDPNGGGAGRKIVDQRLRALAAPPADRLHRPVLAAHLGHEHAHRGDDGGARRPRAGRQGPLHRRLGHAGVEDRRGATDRALPRLVAAHRPADRVLAARAHGRGASSSRWPASSASASRRGRRSRAVCSAASTREERRPAKAIAARWCEGSSTRRPTRSSTSSRTSPRRSTPRSPAWRWPGCRRSRRDLDHHRRAHARSSTTTSAPSR